MEVNHLLTFYLSLITKVLIWLDISKRWSISKEVKKSRTNQKVLVRNHLELLLLPIPPTTTLPQGMHVSVVDTMRVVMLIPVSELKSRTFKFGR